MVEFSPEALEALAVRIAERVAFLLSEGPTPDSLIDAREVARRLNKTAGWVYANKVRLGAVALGDGDRPRIAFDPARVAEIAARGFPKAQPAKPSPAAHKPPGVAELLPIRGGRAVRSSHPKNRPGGRVNAPGPRQQEVES